MTMKINTRRSSPTVAHLAIIRWGFQSRTRVRLLSYYSATTVKRITRKALWCRIDRLANLDPYFAALKDPLP